MPDPTVEGSKAIWSALAREGINAQIFFSKHVLYQDRNEMSTHVVGHKVKVKKIPNVYLLHIDEKAICTESSF